MNKLSLVTKAPYPIFKVEPACVYNMLADLVEKNGAVSTCGVADPSEVLQVNPLRALLKMVGEKLAVVIGKFVAASACELSIYLEAKHEVR